MIGHLAAGRLSRSVARRGRSRGGGVMQTLKSIRLVFRMQQFEIVAVGLMAAALVGAALYVANELNAVGYGPCSLAATPPPSCEALGRRFFGLEDAHASPVFVVHEPAAVRGRAVPGRAADRPRAGARHGPARVVDRAVAAPLVRLAGRAGRRCSRSSSRGPPASRSTASSPRDRPGSTSRTRSTRSASAARSSRSRRSSSSRGRSGWGRSSGASCRR